MVAGPVPPCVRKGEVFRGGYHGSGPPRTGPEPPRVGPGPPRVEAGPPGGLSLQANQGARIPLPTRVGVRSRHMPLWARPLTLWTGAATCSTDASLLPEASPPAALNAGG